MRRFLLLSALLGVAACGDDPSSPPRDAVAPDAVSDLRIESDATIPPTLSLAWTATGDDASEGTAATYDLRASADSLTEANWNAATILEGLPDPAAAGIGQSFQLPEQWQSGLWYLALRVADEAGNWSGLSNVVATPQPGEDFPLATTPEIWVENFRQAWAELDLFAYETGLHEDFSFWFSPEDVFQTGRLMWERELELQVATRMFTGQFDPGTCEPDTSGEVPTLASLSLVLSPLDAWTNDFDDGSEFGEADLRGSFQVDMLVRYAESDLITTVESVVVFYLRRVGVQVGSDAQDIFQLFAWREHTSAARHATSPSTWGLLKSRYVCGS